MQTSTIFILTFIFVIMPVGIALTMGMGYLKSLFLSLVVFAGVGALWLLLVGVFALA